MLVMVVTVACLVLSYVHIKDKGRHFDLRMEDFAGVRIDPDDVQMNPAKMGRVTGISYDGDVPVISFEGREEGEGLLTVTTPNSGVSMEMKVSSDGVIVMDGVDFSGWEAIEWSLVICFGIAFLVFSFNFSWLWRRAWFGYEMVAYLGAAMFCGNQVGVFAKAMTIDGPTRFSDLALSITTMSDRFLLTTFPIVLVIMTATSVSNMFLIRHEGIRLTNLLGVAMCTATALACVMWRIVGSLDYTTIDEYLLAYEMNSVISIVLVFGLDMFLATCICALLAARHRPESPCGYVMVLGCGLRPDGTPTPLLAGRVDAATKFARGQEESGHGLPRLVPSGGQGSDEPISEAESMRRYAVGHGFPDDLILKEDVSTSTKENFLLSAKVIMRDYESRIDAGEDMFGVPTAVAFSTTNYHVLRGYVFAHEAGMEAEGIASPTRLYFWPNAFFREFVGLLVARIVPILLGLAFLVTIYGMAQYAVYVH